MRAVALLRRELIGFGPAMNDRAAEQVTLGCGHPEFGDGSQLALGFDPFGYQGSSDFGGKPDHRSAQGPLCPLRLRAWKVPSKYSANPALTGQNEGGSWIFLGMPSFDYDLPP